MSLFIIYFRRFSFFMSPAIGLLIISSLPIFAFFASAAAALHYRFADARQMPGRRHYFI